MITTDAGLRLALEQLAEVYQALARLPVDHPEASPQWLAVLAEGFLDHGRQLQRQVETYLGITPSEEVSGEHPLRQGPWVDPRVTEVRSAAARSYLLGRGWNPLQVVPANLQPFQGPSGKHGPLVLVPLLEQGGDYTHRIIELITAVALAEGRHAVEVLIDILAQPAEAVTTNGPAATTKAEPSVR